MINLQSKEAICSPALIDSVKDQSDVLSVEKYSNKLHLIWQLKSKLHKNKKSFFSGLINLGQDWSDVVGSEQRKWGNDPHQSSHTQDFPSGDIDTNTN